LFIGEQEHKRKRTKSSIVKTLSIIYSMKEFLKEKVNMTNVFFRYRLSLHSQNRNFA